MNEQAVGQEKLDKLKIGISIGDINGIGLEVMEMCLPILVQGRAVGFTLLTYGLQEILSAELGETYGRRNEISFIEPDGTRLAVHGTLPRAKRLFTATQLLDLPGTTLMLRMDGRRAAPDRLPAAPHQAFP
jgi:two-component system sensor histidine kinase DctS